MPRIDQLIGRDLGSYRILKLLGSGGMGTVYLAEHRAIGHKAAIKVLLRELASDEDTAQRFFNEARAVNLVKHPSIVQIFDYGQAPDVGAYLVMEFLEGQSLGERLRTGGPLEPALAARVLARVCSAIDAAHKSGLIHRDLKPDNIFLLPESDDPTGWRVKVLDFGIAKLVHPGATGVKTQTGTMVGTPLYMAPEYVHGGKKFDHRIDVYSLGVIAFETLSGAPPFNGEGVGQILVAHILEPVPPLPGDVPPALEAVVRCALEKEPAARYQTAGEMGRALLAAIGAPGADEPEEMRAESTTIGPPKAALESLPTVIRAVPDRPVTPAPRGATSSASGARRVAAPGAVRTASRGPLSATASGRVAMAATAAQLTPVPAARIPSTLSVTAAEMQPAVPTQPARRSWPLLVGLAAALLVAASGTVAVLSFATSEEDAPADRHGSSSTDDERAPARGRSADDSRDGERRSGDLTATPKVPSATATSGAHAVGAAAAPDGADAGVADATAAPATAKKTPKKGATAVPAAGRKGAAAAAATGSKDTKKASGKPATSAPEFDLAD